MQLIAFRAAAPQPDDVQSNQICDLTEHIAERDDVAGRARKSRHHGTLADADELMHRGVTAEKTVITNVDVATEHHVVGEDYGIAHIAIVANVASNHQQTMFADASYSAAVFGAGIDGHAFAQLTAWPYNQLGRAAAIVHRLRRRSQRCERIDDRTVTDSGHAGDVNMGDEAHACAKRNAGSDNAIRPNLHAVTQARGISHARGRIDCRHLLLSHVGAELRLGDQHAAHLGLAPVPPNVSAVRDFVDVVFERIAGQRRFAKLGFIDGHEEHFATFVARRQQPHTKYARRLRHALDHQHAGHDRVVWKMSGKLRFVHRDILDADAMFVAADVLDAIDQQK